MDSEAAELDVEPVVRNGKQIVVPLGVAFAIIATTLTVFLGTVISMTWWASSMTAKMDVLIGENRNRETAATALSNHVTDTDRRVDKLETAGSPATSRRLEKVEALVEMLRHDLDVDRASRTLSKP